MRNYYIGIAIGCCLLDLSAAAQKLGVTDLRTEYLKNPMGIEAAAPRLSWKMNSAQRNVMQSAYQIRVGTDSAGLLNGQSSVWDSGNQKSDASVFLRYAGKQLKSDTRYYWQVKIKDNQGNESAWSAISSWHTGLLNPDDWSAQWITSSLADTVEGPSPIFRKVFATQGKVKSAVLYISAHGLYEAQINGKRVSQDHLAPGWTSYHKRLLYQSYEVTNLLKDGQNAIGFTLGDGWYRGYLAFDGKRGFYGKHLSGLVQLVVEYTDGTKKIINSDGSWKYSTGPVRFSDLYNGEIYDAKFEKPGWSTVNYKDAGWKNVQIIAPGKEVLESSISPLASKHEQFSVVKVIKTPKGETVLDFGQNVVGWVSFKLSGKAGSFIKLEHGEVLDKAGNFYDANLRKAKQHVKYIFKGTGVESYEPHFTYQGFRYVKLTGNTANINPSAFKAIAVYSDMDPTGTFTSSNPLLNQLQHNIQWGQKGNFMDVPTDCPQRDERLGWTGDAQVFFRTAAFNMDVAGFFTKWMKDVASDQLANGSIPFVVPNVLTQNDAGSTGWGDVATIIPWNMYVAYGDKQVLATQYPSMKGWVDFMTSKSKNDLWNTGFHFGDWLFYHPEDDNDGRAAITDKYLIAQAFYAHSTQLLINTAKVLGKKDDEEKYTALLDHIKKAFLKEYITPSGRLVSGSQTAYVLALNFDMLPEDLRQQAVDFLVKNIESYGNHLTTGFLGTPYLCHVLTRFGRTDVAYQLLLQETYPSWLYPVKMGATTIWERWDGIKPDGSFQTTGMNSFNHYAYGAIGDWMYRVMAGLDTDESEPGYKKIIIAPQPGGKITQAAAKLETLYGLTVSDWKIEGGLFKLKVVIPPNATALIRLPGAANAAVTESGTALKEVKGIVKVANQGNDVQFNAGSGTYQFEYAVKL
ncbi:glycoside hydrolase family 78 protein [Pedobacter cryoconitis]|uniref:alpha-L-rhamnosidase n=1 Tax=Pedobacter cryoconitis TaxID=188932 RepID=A0A327RX53_9SPHI|nr:glycoside hydrolase family 78 protein [Pedobacter cryoconitis]RAJ21035.1 alpha-L-rhamnosidase [Pedobacter cryoconitis]